MKREFDSVQSLSRVRKVHFVKVKVITPLLELFC